MNENWFKPGGVVPVDMATTGALVQEVQRLRKLFMETANELDDLKMAIKHGPGEAEGRTIAAMQAKIDALMLEYCPGEMTREQIANWREHQIPSPYRSEGGT